MFLFAIGHLDSNVVYTFKLSLPLQKVSQSKCAKWQVIDALLDTDTIPRKPQYGMAPEIPLVLQSCEFEGLRFTCSSGT